MAYFTDRLKAAGYRQLHDNDPSLWCKIWRQGEFFYGRGAIIWDNEQMIMTVGAAVHVSEAKLEALAMVAPQLPKAIVDAAKLDAVRGYVGGRKRGLKHWLRRMRPRFKKRINKLAKRIAKNKIVTKIRTVYAKTLQSPIVAMGVKAAGTALNAFGVPKSVTAMVLNQARNATIDRLQHGGWAGQFQRASAPGGGSFFGKFAKEHGRRHLKQLPKTLAQSLPGGGILAGLAKNIPGKAGKLFGGGAPAGKGGGLGGMARGLGGLLGKGKSKKQRLKGLGSTLGGLGGMLGGGKKKGTRGAGKALGALGGLLGNIGYYDPDEVGEELNYYTADGDYVGLYPAQYNGMDRGNDYMRGYYGV